MKTKKLVRKPRSNMGTTQKSYHFKIDEELVVHLDGEPNKNRLVNELLREHYFIL